MKEINKIKQNKKIKFFFYSITLLLPLLSYLLFSELKGFNVLLISFGTFLTYINLCIFQKMCVFSHEEPCDIQLTQRDLLESIIFGFICIMSMFFLQRVYKLIF